MMKDKTGFRAQPLQPGLLQPDVVIRVEIIQADHPFAPSQQGLGNVESDKARRTRHQASPRGEVMRRRWRSAGPPTIPEPRGPKRCGTPGSGQSRYPAPAERDR